jgi:hypothetical protein
MAANSCRGFLLHNQIRVGTARPDALQIIGTTSRPDSYGRFVVPQG